MLEHSIPQATAAVPDPAAHLGAWVEIDLGAVASNVRALRGRLAPGVRLLAVVKCDAYGHGAEAVAPVALAAGADAVGVGSVPEGVQLRAAGVRAPIWVMGAQPDAAIDLAIAHELELVALAPAQVARLAARAEALGRTLAVHVVLDLGLGRDGCAPADLQAVVAAVEAAPVLRLVGLGASLATFDPAPTGPLDSRVGRFEAATAALAAARPGVVRHAAASTGALARTSAHFDMVRFGDALYGLEDLPELARELGIRPPMAVRARVLHVRQVEAGTTVGYDSAWTAGAPTWLGTLPLGFGDGLPYKLGQGGGVLVAGRRCPVVGRPGMTATVVDLGAVPPVGELVATLLGAADGAEVSIREWAALEGVDPYDLTIRLGRALPRRYLGAAR